MIKADYKLHSQGPQREANEAHGKYATNNEVKSINNKSQMSKDIAKMKVETFTNDLARFTQGKKNFDILLGSQRCFFSKSCES